MYVKKIEGPRAVRLPGGRRMTRADLPPPDTDRWVVSRKAAVVEAVVSGLVTEDWAVATYDLSQEELEGWRGAVARHGRDGLKATVARSRTQS